MNATLSANAKQATENSPIPASPNTQLLPELANRYTPLKELGSGAQGKVFLAIRIADGQKVAIKQLRIDSIKSWKEYTLFHREAETLEKLDIPGVVKFYEACDCLDANPPCSYIVQEYIEGPTLKQVLKSGYRFSLNSAYNLILQLIDILEKLHTHNPPVIHRDIKPSNIILQDLDSDCFKVRLIDFGAVANPQVQSGGSTIAGTFGYMSPEQLIGRATPQSDIYALAALFAYIISGVDPADMKTQDLRLIIDPYVENHPVALVQTLRRMLEPDIENRLADLKELRRRFNAFKQGRYILTNERYQRFSKKEFIDRLTAVKYLCQPQNMEIWHNLPDNTHNRDDFPIWLKTRPRFAAYPIHHEQYFQERKTDDHPEKTFQIAIFGIHIAAAIVAFLCAIYDVDGLVTFGLIGLSAILGTALIILICKLKDRINTLNDTKPKGRLPWISEDSKQKASRCSEHTDIYYSGRKTIATITCIKFMSLKNVNKNRVEAPPTFRVYYKFNPPDDDDINDIIHYVDTHRDPTDLFKVGDPLPILYVTESTKEHELHVTKSMPYPFPLEDLESPFDYIGRTLTLPEL